jgi:hypothetical protein
MGIAEDGRLLCEPHSQALPLPTGPALLGTVEVRAVFKAAVSVPEGFRESTWWADR